MLKAQKIKNKRIMESEDSISLRDYFLNEIDSAHCEFDLDCVKVYLDNYDGEHGLDDVVSKETAQQIFSDFDETFEGSYDSEEDFAEDYATRTLDEMFGQVNGTWAT